MIQINKIETFNYLEKDGNAKVHERFCEVDDIFSRIVDCHRSHRNITGVLHKLLTRKLSLMRCQNLNKI